jgi:hypothetical protein
MHLAQRAAVVGHVLEDLVQQGHIEAPVLEVQVLDVSRLDAARQVGGERRLEELRLLELDAEDVGAEIGEGAHVAAAPAPAVDHAPAAQRTGEGLDAPYPLAQVPGCRRVASGGPDRPEVGFGAVDGPDRLPHDPLFGRSTSGLGLASGFRGCAHRGRGRPSRRGVGPTTTGGC